MINHQGIEVLHKLYVTLTCLEVPLTMPRIYAWEVYESKGYNGMDLKQVVDFIRAGIKKGERRPASLKFSLLIENTERFSEDLAMARAAQTLAAKKARPVRIETRGEQVTGVRNDARPVSEVALNLLRDFRKGKI
jgi:hypothetical protein